MDVDSTFFSPAPIIDNGSNNDDDDVVVVVGGDQPSMIPPPNPIGSPSVLHHTMATGGVAINDSSSSSSFNGTDFSSTSVPIYNGVAASNSGGNTFLLAPGIERSNAAAAAVVLDYTEHFPKLPEPVTPPATINKPIGAWTKPPAVKATLANFVTQVFHLPAEERASKNNNRQFGNSSEEQQKCNTIASATETTIELCEAKDHTLTILITGKRAKVEEARARIIRDLQMQATREIVIPKEHHRVLIGKEGANLRALEADTDCRIIIPGRDISSDVIKVIGPREGIEKAMHQIQLISDEQSKLAQEHLLIPRIYYPWIRGPFNETIDQLAASETGTKINIPPPSAKSEVIVVTGEKEGVHRVVKIIREIFETKQQTVKSVTCKVARAQHRYIIGSQRHGLSEILKETGVSVEVPPEDDESDTITLRGDPARLGDALTLVYAKASSVITAEVTCPAWLHKFLIGPKGATLQTIVTNKEKVQVDFEEAGVIYLEGPPEDVKQTHEALTNAIKRLQAEMATETIKVHPSYHRHVIGRGGALISKIKNETGVQITIPNEQTNSDEIRIEGKKDGVAKATADIIEIVKRIENEKSRDIVIEQRFHKQIIGTKGEHIQKLREQFPSIVFAFPEQGRKSDIVTLRGDKTEVDKCYKLLQQQLESNFQMTVPIFKDFHKHIVGKGGANVRKIREETTTRIDLPVEGSGEDKIIVTGKKAGVEKAVEMLTKIQNELASIVTIETKIAAKLHPRLLGGGQRMIQDIQNECGGVQIRFPPEKSNSDKVTIRGPKEDAERAEKMLLNLAKDRELSSFEDSVTAKSEFHRFLIGRGGTRIKKIRDLYPDVRILFPRESDKDQQTIHMIGRKEDVAQVKITLEKLIDELNETVEISTDVATKWHRHFVIRGATVLREIQDQFGGVSISFPRSNSTDTKVMIKGSKQCVEGAKQRIDEIVEDLECQVSIKVEIPGEYHRTLLANRGQKVQDICAGCNVQIKFPDRRLREEAEQSGGNASSPPDINIVDGTATVISPLNTVTISGRADKCEEAKMALLALVPISESVPVAFECHRYLIGRNGETVRALMHEFDVNISIPSEEKKSDHITVVGSAEGVRGAIEEIRKRVVEFEEQAEDRRLRQFKLTAQVPAEYHQRLIGPRGQTINALRAKHDVQISFPKQSTDDESNDAVVITGYEEKTISCRDEIEAMIDEWKSLFTQEIALDARFHPRLIGAKGRTIRKIMDDYKVEIRLPRSNDVDPNLVTICGKSEDSVYDCIDHLRMIEEEYLQENLERGQYIAHRHDDEPAAHAVTHVEFSNAPWHAVDTNSMDDFPSINTTGDGTTGTNGNAASSTAGVWGGARRF